MPGVRLTPALQRDLVSRGRMRRWATAQALMFSRDPRVPRAIVAALAATRDPPLQLPLVHALGSFGSACTEASEALQAVLADAHGDIAVRAHAAESLGDLFHFADRRTAAIRRAAGTLLNQLEAREPELRFWSAFSLGKMRWRPALPRLDALARSDRGVCRGWWRVAEEASDAAASIRGQPVPERVRRVEAERAPRSRRTPARKRR